MKKQFHIRKLEDDSTWEILDTVLFPYGGSPKPLESLLALLAGRGAKTVIIESEYVDKDYQDEFASFYSRSFKRYDQRCARLHFFSVDIPRRTSPRNLDKYRSKYLGFTVIRPTDLQRIGRTLLSPMVSDQNTEFVTCKAEFQAHILGVKFTVDAMPFIQQDTQVGACAQASLWMLARYMSRKFGYREFFPGEVNELAKAVRAWGRSLPAEWGLDLGQILDALNAMGYSAVVYSKNNIDSCSRHIDKVLPAVTPPTSDEERWKLHIQRTAKLADIAYRYIESGLPTIICTANHAMVGVGHVYDHKVEASVAIQRIPSFIVNNDAQGPYRIMPLFSEDADALSFLKIDEVVVVVPREVTLRGEEAESMAVKHVIDFIRTTEVEGRTFFDELVDVRPEFGEWLTKLEYRTYLRASVAWQRDLRRCIAENSPRAAVARRLLELDYPKYVWITEISSSPLLNHADKGARQCLGCVVVDSTAPARTRGAIAMHVADLLVIHDRQGKEKPYVQYVGNTTPFHHKVWGDAHP